MSFIIIYLVKMSKFQLYEEFAPISTVLIYNIFFIIGFSLFILLSILYFFPLRRNRDLDDSESESNPVSSITNKGAGKKWYNYFRENRKRHIYYIGRNFKIYKSRSIAHLDESVVKQVFSQNRINALIFEIITISAFLSLGFLRNYSLFEVPCFHEYHHLINHNRYGLWRTNIMVSPMGLSCYFYFDTCHVIYLQKL